MQRLKKTIGVVVIVVSIVFSAAVHADSQEKRIEAARKHMERGQEAFLQKRFEEAAGHFEDAYNASPFAAFLYNAGLAMERVGDNERAVGFYRRYLEIAPDASDAEMVKEKIESLSIPKPPDAEEPGSTDALTSPPAERSVEITETEMKSLISIKTNPGDAAVRIISQAGEEISNTSGPLAQTVEAGTYTIEASHPDYRTVTTDIFVSAGQVYVVVVEMSQGAFLGFLRVITEPPGAAVYIDDKALGQAGVTPFSNVLPAEAHRIWIEKPGYVPVEQEINIDISEEVELNLPLERPTYGALIVKTNADDAVVSVDGLPTGAAHIETPFRKQLPVGKHQVLVTRDGLKDYATEVTIEPGQETKLLVRLNSKPSRTSGWVSAGFSVALFAAGTVFGVLSLKIRNDLKSERDNGRLASDDNRILRGFLWGIGADVSFGVGTIIAGMSLYYFLRDPLPPSEGKTQEPVDYPLGESTPVAATPPLPKQTPPKPVPQVNKSADQQSGFLLTPLFGNDTAGLGLVITF